MNEENSTTDTQKYKGSYKITKEIIICKNKLRQPKRKEINSWKHNFLTWIQEEKIGQDHLLVMKLNL